MSPETISSSYHYRIVREECAKAIRAYRAYRKIPFESFQVWACSEKKGAMILARKIVRLLDTQKQQSK
jgi:hypothetical protein